MQNKAVNVCYMLLLCCVMLTYGSQFLVAFYCVDLGENS
jgi:hypothetical protein